MIPLAMIDEASYQGRGWPAPALQAAGIKVVAIKATEGTTYINPMYSWQVQQARQVGCVILHYHLARYGNLTAEVSFFLSVADLKPGEIVMLDNEAQIITLFSASSGSSWVGGFTDQIKSRTGVKSCVQYTSNYPIGAGYLESVRPQSPSGPGEPLFLAYPGANPGNPPIAAKPWLLSFLQYGTRGTPGGGQTDQDAAYFGTLDEVRSLGLPAGPPAHGLVYADGKTSLAQLAAAHKTTPAQILWLTARSRPNGWGGFERAYVDAGNWQTVMRAGTAIWLP